MRRMNPPCPLLPKPVPDLNKVRCFKTFILMKNLENVLHASRNGGPPLPRYYSDFETVYKFPMQRELAKSMTRLKAVAIAADNNRYLKKKKKGVGIRRRRKGLVNPFA